MKRLALYSGIALVVLVLVAALAWWWLTATRSGAAFLLGQVESRVAGLEYSTPRGSLSGGLKLDRLTLKQGELSVEVDQLELAARVRLLPLRLRVERLRAGRVDVRLPPGETAPADPEPFRLGDVMGDFSAPLPVEVDELDLRDIVIRAGDLEAGDAPLLQLDRVALAGRYAGELRLERAVVESASWRVSANGDVGMSAPWPLALETQLALELEQAVSQQIDLTASGPLDRVRLRFEARGPARLEGEVALNTLLDTPAVGARVTAAGAVAGWPGFPGTLESLALDAEGNLEQWRADVSGRVEWPEQPPAELDLALEGAGQNIRVTRANVDVLEGRVSLVGETTLGDGAIPDQAGATVDLKGIDPGALAPEWPEGALLNGGFQADWNDGVLSLKGLRLEAPPTPLSVSGSASLDTATRVLALGLEWRELRWPLLATSSEDATADQAKELPLFSSESGRLDGSGTLDEWRAELEAWLTLPDQPRARLNLRADGDLSVVNLRDGQLRFDQAGGASITGRVALSDPPTARLDVRLDRFDPGAFLAQLPGRLSGRIGLALDGVEPLRVALELEALEGVLRQVPVRGSGRAALVDRRLERGSLELEIGANAFELSSADGDAWRVNLDAGRLDQLWPELSGEMRVRADVIPSRRQAEWSLESPGLGWDQIRSGEVTSSGALNWGTTPNLDLALNAVDVDLNPWERLDRIEVLLDGGCSGHRLRAYAGGTRATVDLEAQGRMPDCLDNPAHWSGSLQRLTVAETPVGAWQLNGPLEIVNDENGLRAGPGCLWTTSSDGRLCLNELRSGTLGTARLAFNSVPIDMLLVAADPVFTLGSDLKGLARVDWGPGGIRSVDSRLILGEGAVRMLDSDEELLAIQGADLELSSPREGALNARLALRFAQQSKVTAIAAIPDLNQISTTRLDARADLLLPNLGAINRLVPQLDQLGGRLEAGLRVRGALTNPELDGQVAIREGRFLYSPLGSRVEALELVLDANEQGGTLEGSFAAGDGEARIRGQLEPGPETGWTGQASIVGQQLRMFDVDWLEMTVTPDLQLGFTTDLLELNGVLAIDRARLGLPPGAETRVPVSEDVVIADGRDQAADAEPAPPARDIAGTVQLRLGDDTQMAAAGMETSLAGTLDVEWTPGLALPVGRGRIQLVDGSYRAYGQNLEVTEGDVLFTGNPIDNPILEIEAVRQIFGDPQVEQAGVRIRGPARDPEINLFTAPPTSREKALAYVLTGADFDHAAGQGAFSVGFWVLPQVFVSYGLGLFDTGNVLAVRWDLSRRWGLRATSGERDTGADISFIIDR